MYGETELHQKESDLQRTPGTIRPRLRYATRGLDGGKLRDIGY